MPIEGFNSEEFAKNLITQANELVPKEFNDQEKQYVVNKIYQFCILAGNALNQEENLSVNADQAYVITQYVCEWCFHKAVDAIRGGVSSDNWDYILQQVAFAVFEMAKYTQINKIEHAQEVALIEKEVLKSYEQSVKELAETGKVSEESIQKILQESNIDKMAEEANKNRPESDSEKTFKLASVALLLKSLPQEKAKKILASLDQSQSNRIIYYMNMPDLEKKLDSDEVAKSLKEFKKNLLLSKKPGISSQIDLIKRLKSLYSDNNIKNKIKFERPGIRAYVEYCLKNTSPETYNFEFSPYISEITLSYLRLKLSA